MPDQTLSYDGLIDWLRKEGAELGEAGTEQNVIDEALDVCGLLCLAASENPDRVAALLMRWRTKQQRRGRRTLPEIERFIADCCKM